MVAPTARITIAQVDSATPKPSQPMLTSHTVRFAIVATVIQPK